MGGVTIRQQNKQKLDVCPLTKPWVRKANLEHVHEKGIDIPCKYVSCNVSYNNLTPLTTHANFIVSAILFIWVSLNVKR